MITIWPGVKRADSQPYSVTINSEIFFITHHEDSEKVEFNCSVDDIQKEKLRIILNKHLTTGKNVLY